MGMEGSWSEVVPEVDQSYTYNGKELQDDLGLDWLDYGARFYDPAIGRFGQIDPLAEGFDSWSSYNYVLDNPIRLNDPTGKSPEDPIAVDFDKENFDRINNTQKKKTLIEPNSETNDNQNPNFNSQNNDNHVIAGADGQDCGPCFLLPLALPSLEALFVALVGTTTVLVIADKIDDINTLEKNRDQYIPPPKTLPGFPDAQRVKPKAGRKRWIDGKGRIHEWDSQHGEVEIYDKTGKNHKGAFDPDTGKQVKPPVPGRTTPK